MNLNIGDKVKFLNAKGGGIVSKIIDSRMVSIAIEGGFEIPTLISELVRLEGNEPAARYFNETYRAGKIEKSGQAEPVGQEMGERTEDDRIVELPAGLLKNRKTEEILLAFVPHDQKWLITGMIDVMLINNSSYDILYNLFLQVPSGGFAGKDYGSCFPDSILLLDTISREQISGWTSGYLQFLFHKGNVAEVLPPFNSQFKVSGQKFYNESGYKESPFIQGKAILVKVLSLSGYFQLASAGDKKVIEKREPSEDNALVNKHRVNPREAEVDLHIHELAGDEGLPGNSEILDIQKNYFQRCLESALAGNFLKVTFIHGVGNGVLRDAILEILKTYDGLEVFDAPMEKYGVGAIEVRIPHNL